MALTAIGTFALAAVTLVTLLATMVIAWRADKQVTAERRAAQDREQLFEAHAVQVVFGGKVTIVVNKSRFTITDIEARIMLSNGCIAKFAGRDRLLNLEALDAGLREGASATPESVARPNLLTPWDIGLRLVGDTGTTFADAYPIVRWTDRWGTRWDHRLGEAKPIEPGACWTVPFGVASRG